MNLCRVLALHFQQVPDADRQLAVWEQTRDLKAIVDHVVEETYEKLTIPRRALVPA